MKPGMHLRLSQQLALTPQLQQSIRLLQLSTIELNQEIEQALHDNPLLERDDDPLAGHLRLNTEGTVLPAADAAQASPTATQEVPAGGEAGHEDGGDEEQASGEDAGSWNSATRSSKSSELQDESPQDWATAAPNLRDHLRMQLSSTSATGRDRALVAMLIEAVDESGYLGVPLDELQALCGRDDPVEMDELVTALRLLQSFDPPGVGARDASECMRLQLDVLITSRDETYSPGERQTLLLARRIVCEHLQLLATRDFARLRKALDASDAQLRAAHQRIRGLSPHPGVGFASSASDYVIPDILVRRSGGRWVARLNPDVVPRLRVNQAYAAILKSESGKQAIRHARPSGAPGGAAQAQSEAAPASTDWSSRLQDARWLIRNLRQRFQTIERVAQAIVERQSRFFTYGAIAMRPLVLREIAATLGLHESTISRVTANKYMATPFGVFELRYFFGSHVATEAGGEASSTAIRALIRQLVEAEDAITPLSDSRIAELLAAQGMMVARRTVAKYRELLQIPPAAMRKTI